MEHRNLEDCVEWLKENGMDDLIESCKEQKVDGPALMTIVQDADMLKEFVPKIGIRARLKYHVLKEQEKETSNISSSLARECAQSPSGSAVYHKECTPTQEVTLEEVKRKLNEIKDHRKSSSVLVNKKVKRRKTEYLIHCGIKEHKFGNWVLSRKYRVIKVTFGSEDNYATVKQKLLAEFGLTDEERLVILNMADEEVDEENFTIYKYNQNQKKYVGTTRMYIGISTGIETVKAANPDAVSSGEPSVSSLSDLSETSTSTESTPSSVNVETAIDCIKKEFDELQNRGASLEIGELGQIDKSKFCPVYAYDPKVLCFITQNNRVYETVKSGWGDFFCVPLDDMDLFVTCKDQEEYADLFLVNDALIYFLSNIFYKDSELVTVIEVTKTVWKLLPEAANAYMAWKEKIINCFCT